MEHVQWNQRKLIQKKRKPKKRKKVTTLKE
jgi:hypothetical protein